MTIFVVIIGGLVGWGVTPMPKPPGPKDPLAGFIGGIVGAFAVHWALGFQGALSAAEFIAVAIGAFAGGRVLFEVAGWVFPSRARG